MRKAGSIVVCGCLLLFAVGFMGSALAQKTAAVSGEHFLPVIVGGDTQAVPTATLTGTGQPSATSTSTGTVVAVPPTVMQTATGTVSASVSATVTPTPTATDMLTWTPTPTATGSIAATATSTATPTATATATNTSTPTATATATSTATPTATATSGDTDPGFIDCVSRTGSNATVAVSASILISGGFEPAVGDQLAIFTPDGSICAGVATWTGSNIAVTAWGDNAQTSEIDGLRGGETMTFRIWDQSADEVLLVTAVTYSLGNGVYTADSIHIVSSFAVAPL